MRRGNWSEKSPGAVVKRCKMLQELLHMFVEGSGRRGDWALDAAGANRLRHDDPPTLWFPRAIRFLDEFVREQFKKNPKFVTP